MTGPHITRWKDEIGDLLGRLLRVHEEDRSRVEEILDLIDAHDDCLERTCLPGHLTASAWILSPDRETHLLIQHRKLQKWLQPGGHVDGQADLLAAALREAREETGIERFTVLLDGRPLDVDVHDIPALGGEPPHQHHDVRFLIQAEPGQRPIGNDESSDLRWFGPDEVRSVTSEASVLRLLDRALQHPE